MTKTVRIVTDSACDLPQTLISSKEISVVPLTIRFGDEEFVDRIELSNEQFWGQMERSSTLPSTAAPSPGAFENTFRESTQAGTSSVVCITLSSKLSATYQNAVAGKRLINDEIDVRVIDSQLCTIGQGLLVLKASEMASEGASVDEVEKEIEDLRSHTYIYGALDTLENLRKGGRIGAAGAFFGSLLSVKPIIELRDGEVQAESRQRTRTRALNHLVKLVSTKAPLDTLALSHANAPDVEEFLELLDPIVEKKNILVSDIGPVIGTHGGPRTMAVAFSTKNVS